MGRPRIGTPPGFQRITLEENTDDRYYFRCTHCDSYGFQCNFKFRSDRFPMIINTVTNRKEIDLKHQHDYGLHFPKATEIEKKRVSEKLMKVLALFLATSNTSINYITSSNGRAIILLLIQIGIDLGENFDLNTLIKYINYRAVRSTMIIQSNTVIKERLSEFRYYKYASIAIDGGTILHQTKFDVIRIPCIFMQ